MQAIARGIGEVDVEQIDVTKPGPRQRRLHVSETDVLVVAVPVYVGRVPDLLRVWLHGIRADRTPTLCVVVYGNRDYEDALLELRDVMKERGGVPIACAAFIGEHSFSSPETPIAVSRPDPADLRCAEAFGRRVREKLRSISSLEQAYDVDVPGKYPYKHLDDLYSVDFIATSDQCGECGVCAESCPEDAIDREDHALVDKEKCILCCACIKRCPENAKAMKAGIVKDIAARMSEKCRERREPALFF